MTAEATPVSTGTQRLGLGALDQLRRDGSWTPPAVDPRAVRVGVVHLGLGAFARAHQAVHTELAAAATGDESWGIAGVTQRSASVRDQLVPQDGLYTVLERGPGATPLRVVGSVRDVVDGSGSPETVVARLADSEVRLVTLTVTEKGYRRRADGALDLADTDVAADIAGRLPVTVVGRLVRGLRRRYDESRAPVTVLSCDNLVANGTVLRDLVSDFCDALPAAQSAGLQEWLAESVRFPSCMVDRIVPRTTDADRATVRDLLGLDDHGLVVTEPFSQWVVEDDFATSRPAWERAGVVLTDDVAPWETVKLRTLNSTHSLLAYLGALRGYRTIAEAMHDDDLVAAAQALMVDDVAPTLQVPAGLDLADYQRSVLERFANPALAHTTTQVAMDGSQKLPVRLLGTVRDRLAEGAVPQWASLAVAGWMAYVVRCCADGGPGGLDDPLAVRLCAAVDSATAAADIVDRLLGIPEVFGTDLADEGGLRAVLVDHVQRLTG